jgi:hypothetical protein
MYDICLSDYHGVDEGLPVIMRIVPAMPVRHHSLVSVGQKDHKGFATRAEGDHTNEKVI